MTGPRNSSMTKQRTRRARPEGPGQSAGSGRKRWLRVGPGLVLALLAIVLLWPTLRDGMRSDRPRIERSQLAVIPAPPAAPELGWLLEQRDALELTPAQGEKLGRLKTRWDRETQSLREGLDEASREFERGIGGGEGPPRSIQQIQERAAPLSELSRRLAEARRAYWSEAARLLTPAQRRQAEDAWTRRLGGRQLPPARRRGTPMPGTVSRADRRRWRS